MHLHDHLATSEEGVADELARAQSNLRIGHVGGWTFDLRRDCQCPKENSDGDAEVR